MKIGVIQFPGSLDDRDAVWAFEKLGAQAELIWHGDHDLRGADAIIVPGGFSYGDYLRCGAIARFAPVMEQVAAFARDGGIVLGICNGFQVLCEAGLLPGALVRNEGLKYRCVPVTLRVESNRSPHLSGTNAGDTLRIPIKHGEGRYVADAGTIARMEANGQVALRYDGENPNGSVAGIAGVTNEAGNVLGMMPHPEHAVDDTVGIRSADGAIILGSILKAVAR
ncbi:MAG TPA: phosphoribosylformylglycinamidine synthase subunit PurQ [Actinomycetota bacterium]|nr:phosphoribosylformylglycinamidine synthase subunit PurQ [Actinomycetota bacterium]